jgi:hypothetical protein
MHGVPERATHNEEIAIGGQKLVREKRDSVRQLMTAYLAENSTVETYNEPTPEEAAVPDGAKCSFYDF